MFELLEKEILYYGKITGCKVPQNPDLSSAAQQKKNSLNSTKPKSTDEELD
jgi:hypothetical protein